MAVTAATLSIWNAANAQNKAYLIEGEAFQFKGKWVVEKSSDCLGTAMLRVFNDGDTSLSADALTVFDITEAGTYQVWTRSQDYENSARPRTFTLSIDGKTMNESGAHGVPAFYWEHVGEISLEKKKVLMRLSDTGQYYGRCDAILLVKDSLINPNSMTNSEIARWRRNPVVMDYSSEPVPALETSLDIAPGYTTLASANNGEIRISFVKLADENTIVCKTDYYAAGSWRRFAGSTEDNRLAIISSDHTTKVNHNSFYPSWNNCTASRTLKFNGQQYQVRVDGDITNPFFSGKLIEARATTVKKETADCIKVTYDCGNTGELTGYWTVAGNGPHIFLRLVFTPARDGAYSFVLHGAKGIASNNVSGVLMPPMFSGLRIPGSPLMMFSSMMSQCLSVVETSAPSGAVSAFVSADLDAFPTSWGSIDYSPIGFTLMNSNNEFQPVAFSPLPGMSDSDLKAGQTTEARFITGIKSGSWRDALEYTSENIFCIKDYRHPIECSVTKTVENLVTLLKDDTYSGWNAGLKGFWDIEANGNTTPTVVQSAPLALIGTSTLMHDEDMYERRALPAIEYTLSRNGYRMRANQPHQLSPFSSQFPTTLYEGINTLTGELNPWLADLALPYGKVRASNGYFSTLKKSRQELAAYYLTGDTYRLSNAVKLADIYADEIMSDRLPDMTQESFYNSQMYPDWTPLLDMYAETGDDYYLDAASYGAAHTVAGVRTWPKIPAGNMTVHPDNVYDGITTVWWKGTERYRLGFPRHDGDAPEHETEAWKVSPVGLGIEQPATYFVRTTGKNTRPIFMNSWAPRLMELSEYTGRTIFNTYGRNAIIGRSGNYPGYYATGYTDITLSEHFPYTGPDVSSIYYHHIPAYLAMMQDCLVTGIISHSNGAVQFRPARQEGFVWFSNNIYGGTRGTINGREATLYMPHDAVTTDNHTVNTLTARSTTQFHIILNNDSDEDTDVTLLLSDEIAQRLTCSQERTLKTHIAAHNVEIISLDADFSDFTDIAPLQDGMQTTSSGTIAGTLYLYRIRSPFGWDSVYGFADCGAIDGLTIIAECDDKSQTASTWPYEWSFSRFAYDKPAEIKITILKNGNILKTFSMVADTNPLSGISTTVNTERDKAMKGIYNIYGQRIECITSPGFYIVNGHKKLFLKN